MKFLYCLQAVHSAGYSPTPHTPISALSGHHALHYPSYLLCLPPSGIVSFMAFLAPSASHLKQEKEKKKNEESAPPSRRLLAGGEWMKLSSATSLSPPAVWPRLWEETMEDLPWGNGLLPLPADKKASLGLFCSLRWVVMWFGGIRKNCIPRIPLQVSDKCLKPVHRRQNLSLLSGTSGCKYRYLGQSEGHSKAPLRGQEKLETCQEVKSLDIFFFAS